MAKLIYSAITSLDGYAADEDGNFDWAEPDEEVHAFVNDLEGPIDTYLYGRRMYEVMVAWETMDLVDQPTFIRHYAEICVHQPRRDRLGREVGTADADVACRRRLRLPNRVGLKRSRDPGPRSGDGVTRSLPERVRVGLELLDERRFSNGVVHLHYRTST